MSYITAIKTALLTFPVISLLFTIPFILNQYHKYGSVNKFRILIIYSFVLYLLCVYYLIILPLPNIKTMKAPTESMIKLIPFGFVLDIIKETTFQINNPSTYIKSLFDPCIYTVVLNIVMTIPFGIYLRYYFKYDKKKTIKLSLCLSLFFELTQLSRLYFIYPYQYRIFDVDDLLMNTLGGLIGYYIAPIINKILPSREKIDNDSYIAGERVSGLRRISLFCLDLFIYFVFTLFTSIFIRIKYILFITFIVYYIIFPIVMKGQTFGDRFLNVKMIYPKYERLKDGLRVIFLYLNYLILPPLLFSYLFKIVIKLNQTNHQSLILYFLLLGLVPSYICACLFNLIKNDKIYYDKLFKVKYINTIKINKDLKEE
jgi:glycopeptide antibiotics resistance protein